MTNVAPNRIVNDPAGVVEDAVSGYLKAYPDVLAPTQNPRVLRQPLAPIAGKVGVISGGGSGHEPAFLGYVGSNLLDAVAIGEIFSSPTAQSFFDAMKAADGGRGVACLYGNYAGDNMNVKLAIRMATQAGIAVRTVVANDDVASAPPAERDRRRGVAGEILMWKIGAARAAAGGDLDAVIAAAQKAIDNTRSIGIGLAPCTIAAVGHPNFEIKPGTMEIGIGHHGEPGVSVGPIQPAREMADSMVDAVMAELTGARRVAVLVSGLGATPVMEAHILYSRVHDALAERGVQVARAFVGDYFTSLDMMGATLTVMQLDDELEQLLATPARSVGLVVS